MVHATLGKAALHLLIDFVALVFMFTAQVSAQPINEDADAAALAAIPLKTLEAACIRAAAEKIPKIPRIKILASRTTLLNPNEVPKGSFYTTVHIDAKAAGVTTTYNFLCSRGYRTPYFIDAINP